MGNGDEKEEKIRALESRILELEKGLQADDVFRSVASHSPSNILLLDLDLRVQYINRTVPGITPDETVGLELLSVIEEQFHEEIKSACQHVVETGTAGRYETSYTSPSGHLSWWESKVGPVFNTGEVSGLVVVSTDTTEERNRLEAQERFFDLSVDMMCMAGFDGHFMRVNQIMKSVLGYDEELLTQPFLDFVHPDDKKSTIDAFSHLLDGEAVIDFTNRYRTSKGDYRVFSWRGTADHKKGVVYAVARDITDARSLEKKLQESRKLEAIGKLAGGIAHDFNNLLMAIGGNLELATEEPETAEASLRAATQATQRASALTHQLLTFSRNQKLSPKLLDVKPLINDMMSLLKRLLPESIEVRVEYQTDTTSIFADASQMEQVFANLCLNAKDAMPDGGVLQLTINDSAPPSSDEDNTKYLSISVADNGCGMTPEVRERIFEPFFTTKEVGKGTGLGLATVYGIIQNHDGLLNVQSEPGQGTTVFIQLPLAETQEVVSNTGTRTKTLPQRGTETILVAEDEPLVREVIVRMLRQAGYAVLAASDGVEATTLFTENKDEVALVLLDVVMPNRGGLDAASRIRKEAPSTRIIFASGHVQEARDRELLNSEVLLSKPYQRIDLLCAVRAALDQNEASEPARLASD